MLRHHNLDRVLTVCWGVPAISYTFSYTSYTHHRDQLACCDLARYRAPITAPIAWSTNITPSPSHALVERSNAAVMDALRQVPPFTTDGWGEKSTAPLPPFVKAPRKAPTPPCSKLLISQLEMSFQNYCGGPGVGVSFRHPQWPSSSRKSPLPLPSFRHPGTGGTRTTAFPSFDASLAETSTTSTTLPMYLPAYVMKHVLFLFFS